MTYGVIDDEVEGDCDNGKAEHGDEQVDVDTDALCVHYIPEVRPENVNGS